MSTATGSPSSPALGHAVPSWTGTEKLRHYFREPRAVVGTVVTGLILLIAFIGPLVAPHAQGAIIGRPFAPPSAAAPLGTDYLGEDVLSRVLEGGRSLVLLAIAGTIIGVVAGAAIGLIAAYSDRFLDETLMRAMDVLLAFPAVVLILLFVSVVGTRVWLLPLLVGLAWTPQVARVAYGAANEAAAQEFVESAEAMGAPRRRIVRREILPNVMTPLAVDFGLRLAWSIGLITTISFLGVGLQPPAADWGLMIQQNYGGMTLQPWAVLVPIACVAVFALGVNLMTEGLARTVSGVSRRQG